MSDDPISQLPEPYRVAWKLLHKPFDYIQMLQDILVSAQKMARATWGMMILATDLGGLEVTFPGFRTLPDMYNTTIPVGHISSLAYVFARKVIQDGQGILIPDTDNLIEFDESRLLDKFLPQVMRERITKRSEEEWFASRLLEIPGASPFTAMALPIVDRNKTVGSVYLHRLLSEGAFTNELFGETQTFLACVAISVTNAGEVKDIKHLGFQVIASASAELRTPLTVIQGYSKMLREQPLKTQEDVGLEKLSTIIQNNADRIRLVLDDLLDYARIEQGIVYKRGINLIDVINPIIDKYRLLIAEKHQSFVLDLPSSLDIEVAADDYLSHLIEMFVRGAQLYTPDGGEIKISIAFNQDLFQLRVSDSGPSLTEDEHSHLFQRYYHSKRDEVVRGSGLDLYLAKRLVDLWDGQIGVESSLNQGNIFWLTLPLKKD